MEAFKNRFLICYWCGKPATCRDHVPPKNLFPEGHRKDLLKVGACREHNEQLSKLDERLRYHMTLMGDNKFAKNHFESKTLSGLNRPEGIGLTIDLYQNTFIDYNGKNWQRDHSKNFDLYFEKIIRGLFFYHFGKHVDGTTSFFSNKMQLLGMSENVHFYYYLLESNLSQQWLDGDSKNKEIFDYKYYYSALEDRFFVVMTFYKEHIVTGVTLPPGKTIDDYGLDFEDYLNHLK